MKTIIKKVTAAVLSLTLTLSISGQVSAVTGNPGTADPDNEALASLQGNGTENDPFLINDLDDLIVMRDFINSSQGSQQYAYWQQTADIDVSSVGNWTPIGCTIGSNYVPNIFSGVYDGGGYSITGMTITSTGGEGIGFFGFISKAEIRDLAVYGSITHKNAYSHSAEYGVGGIVGETRTLYSEEELNPESSCVISGCTSGVNITVGSEAGGICGVTETDTQFINCEYVGTVTASLTASSSYVYAGIGGICGISYGDDVYIGCADKGSITTLKGDISIGGIVGWTSNASVITIESCYNTGSITSAQGSLSTGVGGIVGKRMNGYNSDEEEADKMSIKYCYNTGILKVNSGDAEGAMTTGGIVGRCVSVAVDGSEIWTDDNLVKVYNLRDTADYCVRAVDNDGTVRNYPGTSGTAETLRYIEDMAQELDGYFLYEDEKLILPREGTDAVFPVVFNCFDAQTGLEISGVHIDLDYENGLAPGRYTYTASKSGYTSVSGEFNIVRSEKSVNVYLTPVSYVYTLTVAPASAVVSMTSEIAEADPISVEKAADNKNVTYTFALNSAVYGEYSCSVKAYGYEPCSFEIECYQDESRQIALAAAEKYDVTFEVKDEEGLAAADISLTVTNLEFNVTESSADGRNYRLAPGEYKVSTSGPGYKAKEQEFTVGKESTSVSIVLEKDIWNYGEYDISWYDEDASDYYIYTSAQLAGVSELAWDQGITFAGKTINLMADLDLGGSNDNQWIPIGPNATYAFRGTFNGNGHSISGLLINKPETYTDDYTEEEKLRWDSNMGLFGYVYGAEISDLTIISVSDEYDTGTIVRSNSMNFAGLVSGHGTGSTFRNIETQGVLYSEGLSIGGICGDSIGCRFYNCVNRADINGAYNVGGIAGSCSSGKSVFQACANFADIYGYCNYYVESKICHGIGGIAGYSVNTITLKECANLGSISGNSMDGGILGSCGSAVADIQDCYNTGIITITDDPVTESDDTDTETESESDDDTETDPVSTGETIVQDGLFAGGILGYGYTGTPSRCLSAGMVQDSSGVDNVTGVFSGLGSTEFSGNDNYYLETLGSDEAAAGFSENEKAALASRLGSSYCNDFGINNGYPVLRWQNPESSYTVTFNITYDNEANLGKDYEITVEGEAVDGLTVSLPVGSYDYSVSQEGYETFSGRLHVVSSDITEDVEMKAEYYTLSISVNGDVQLFAEGQSEPLEQYSADGDTVCYRVLNGTYSYLASRVNYYPEQGSITVSFADVQKSIELEKAPVYNVGFSVSVGDSGFYDWSAAVYNDAGCQCALITAGTTAELCSGTYSYVLKAEGYVSVEGTFEVGASDLNVPVKMEKIVSEQWDGTSNTDWYVDSQSEFNIYTPQELAGLAQLVNSGNTFEGKTVNLMLDIDLGNRDWTAIGYYSSSSAKRPFSGTFNGNGHLLTMGGSLKSEDGNNFGLFGYTDGADIRSVVITGQVTVNLNFTSAMYNLHIGKLIGWAEGTRVSQCSNRGELNVNINAEAVCFSYIGGLVGYATGNLSRGTVITSSNNTGAVNASAEGDSAYIWVGGAAGYINGTTSAMKGCYNAGNIIAAGSTARAGGILGSVSNGTITGNYDSGNVRATTSSGALVGSGSVVSDNYYLYTVISSCGTARTDAQMHSQEFAETLGTEYFRYVPGAFPANVWEIGVSDMEINTMPEKTEYDDLEAFDDSGLTLKLIYENGNEEIIASGWTVVNGAKLGAQQKEVIISYLGKNIAVPVSVRQIEHVITSDYLKLKLQAPVTGQTPGKLSITGTQSLRYKGSVEWKQAGLDFDGVFEPYTYYHADITLTSVYQEGNVYYVFGQDSVPTVDGSLEILNRQISSDGKTMTFSVTYRVSDVLNDRASHLYYEGISGYDTSLLESSISITIGDVTENVTVRQIEEQALKKDGIQYKGFNGVSLYKLINTGRALNLLDDSSTVTVGTKTISLGELRENGTYIVTYGKEGPYNNLKLIWENESGGMEAAEFTSIIVTPVAARTYTAHFYSDRDVPQGAELIVTDSRGNVFADMEFTDDGADVVLRYGADYRYTASASGYSSYDGEFTNQDSIRIILLKHWDGTYKEPEVSQDGYYLVSTPEELAWIDRQATGINTACSAAMNSALIRLTDDISMEDFNWIPIGPNETTASISNGTDEVYSGGQFAGVFDGNEHMIYNLTTVWKNAAVSGTTTRIEAFGLIGYARGAVIKNVGVEYKIRVGDATDYTGDWLAIGGIAGWVTTGTHVTGCYADVDIQCVPTVYGNWDTFVGGIAGVITSPVSSSVIDNCYSTGSAYVTTTGYLALGGIAGSSRYGDSVITKCYSSMTLEADPDRYGYGTRTSYIGGILGEAAGITVAAVPEVSYCFALNTLLDGHNGSNIQAGRVIGEGSIFGGSGVYNYALDTMVIQNAQIAEHDEEDSGYRTSWGRDITAEKAAMETTYTNVLWNSESTEYEGETYYRSVNIWSFPSGRYPIFAWQENSRDEEDQDESFFVIINNKTSGAVQMDIETDFHESHIEFTVSCDIPCAVMLLSGTEGSVSVLDGTAAENGRRYSVDLEEDTEIIVRVKGDMNGDGVLTASDALLASEYYSAGSLPEKDCMAAIEAESPDRLTQEDIMRLRGYISGAASFTW